MYCSHWQKLYRLKLLEMHLIRPCFNPELIMYLVGPQSVLVRKYYAIIYQEIELGLRCVYAGSEPFMIELKSTLNIYGGLVAKIFTGSIDL